MKKIILSSLILLACAGSAFAAAGSLTSGSISQDGFALYGGVDATAAQNAPNPLIRFSSKVNGRPYFDTTQYVLATKHQTGNKVFGTANDATQIFWKQSVAGKLDATNAAGADLTTRCVGGGWTAY